MSDYLTSLIRRERGLARQDAVAPRLPSAFEDHAEVSDAREEIRTVDVPSVMPTDPVSSPSDHPEVSARAEPATEQGRTGPPATGARPSARAGTAVTTLHVVESPNQGDPVVTPRDRASALPTPVTSGDESRRDVSVSPAPERSERRTEERQIVLTRVDVREAGTDLPRTMRAAQRVDPVGHAIEPRPVPDDRLRPTDDAGQPAPTIHVTIGRIDIRAVTAEPPAKRPATAPSHPPMGLDEYLERRNRGSQP